MRYKMFPIHIHPIMFPEFGNEAGSLNGKLHIDTFVYPKDEIKK